MPHYFWSQARRVRSTAAACPPIRKHLKLSGSIQNGSHPDLLLEAELLILSFATGIQDAATYNDYQCFASNQTGNTVLLAVGLSGLSNSSFSLRMVGVSLGTFLSGCYLMGQLGNLVGPRKRPWVLVTNVLQTALVFAAVGIQWAVSSTGLDATAMVVVTLLAVSSGAQVAMARPLNIPQITTAMATAAYVDLLIDPRLHSLHNRHRNRRFFFLAMLVAGAFVGAFARSRVNSAFALLLSAVGKSIVTLLFLFNVSDESSEARERLKTESSATGLRAEQEHTEGGSGV